MLQSRAADAQLLNIDRIHPNYRPVVAMSFKSTHAPIILLGKSASASAVGLATAAEVAA